MDLSILGLILSTGTLALVFFIFLKLRDQNTSEKNKTDNLETKIDSVSKEINEILDYFFEQGILTKYPAVLDLDSDVRVSQFEHTIFVPNDSSKNAEVLS